MNTKGAPLRLRRKFIVEVRVYEEVDNVGLFDESDKLIKKPTNVFVCGSAIDFSVAAYEYNKTTISLKVLDMLRTAVNALAAAVRMPLVDHMEKE